MELRGLTLKEMQILNDLKAVMEKHGIVMKLSDEYALTIKDSSGLIMDFYEDSDFDYING